jgi:hypothetical protein
MTIIAPMAFEAQYRHSYYPSLAKGLPAASPGFRSGKRRQSWTSAATGGDDDSCPSCISAVVGTIGRAQPLRMAQTALKADRSVCVVPGQQAALGTLVDEQRAKFA